MYKLAKKPIKYKTDINNKLPIPPGQAFLIILDVLLQQLMTLSDVAVDFSLAQKAISPVMSTV